MAGRAGGLVRHLEDPDHEKVRRVTQAMLATQGKFDLAELRAAFEGTSRPSQRRG